LRSLRTGSWRDVLLAGLAQGLAFLSKSYLAGIIIGVGLTAWVLPLCRMARRDDCRIGPARLLALVGVTLGTVAPWLLYCATAFPEEFAHEHAQVWRHLFSNVENWTAPWDRLAFDYLIAIYGVFYTPILVATFILLGQAGRRRHAGLWLTYAWIFGVLAPHLFAVSKTPSATLLALPACFLLLGHFVAEAWRGERWPLAALVAIAAINVLFPAVIRNPGHGYPPTAAFGGVMRQSLWVVGHVGGALGLAGVLIIGRMIIAKWHPLSGTAVGRCVRTAALVFSTSVFAWLGMRTAEAAWRVTSANVYDPANVALGQFVRESLSDNAVLLCEELKAGEHVTTMFYADRTCYSLERHLRDETARQIVGAGGIPYVVTRRRLMLPLVYETRLGLTLYRWQVP
jgi:hypothetical protein